MSKKIRVCNTCTIYGGSGKGWVMAPLEKLVWVKTLHSKHRFWRCDRCGTIYSWSEEEEKS